MYWADISNNANCLKFLFVWIASVQSHSRHNKRETSLKTIFSSSFLLFLLISSLLSTPMCFLTLGWNNFPFLLCSKTNIRAPPKLHPLDSYVDSRKHLSKIRVITYWLETFRFRSPREWYESLTSLRNIAIIWQMTQVIRVQVPQPLRAPAFLPRQFLRSASHMTQAI